MWPWFISFRSKPKSEFLMGLTQPIHVSGTDWVPLIIWRNDKQFGGWWFDLAEIASTVVGIQMLNYQREEDEANISSSDSGEYGCQYLVFTWTILLLPSLGNEITWDMGLFQHAWFWFISSPCRLSTPEIESAGIIESRSLEWREPISKRWYPDIFEETRKRLLMAKAYFWLITPLILETDKV